MNRILKNEKMTQMWFVLLLCLAIPALASGQKKGSAPPSHASAPHASAPARSAPSHSTGQTHSAPTHSAPSHSTGQTRSAPTHSTGSAGQTHSAPSHSTAQTRSAPSHTTAAGHGTTAGHGSAAGHGTAAGHGNTTAGRGTAAGHGNTTAGHGTAAGHGNAAASRGNFSHPAGTRNVSLKGGGRANVRANGSIRSVDRNGMHIEHGVHGGRTVVSVHNNVRVVTHGRGGYVQHAYFSRGGRSFYSRTYVYGGVVHVGVYRGYYWGGRPYYGFYPTFWYHPAFYGWAFQPWGVPVVWGVGAWGWGGPWWGYYGGWFTPYPVYAAPAFWLTDYLIAANLQAAYAARAERSCGPGGRCCSGGGCGRRYRGDSHYQCNAESRSQAGDCRRSEGTVGGAAGTGVDSQHDNGSGYPCGRGFDYHSQHDSSRSPGSSKPHLCGRYCCDRGSERDRVWLDVG